jgi:hypothetical protein
MSSLLFAQAKKIRKDVLKAKDLYTNAGHSENIVEDMLERKIDHACQEFREILLISEKLKEVYEDVCGSKTTNWFFITIRPQQQISWNDFHAHVLTFVKRKAFIDYTLSFEQKGMTTETLGEGFHVHIVANCKWRSKGEALRDTQSSFNKMCAPNCIEVLPTRGPDQIIQNYLLDYKSDDNHKICTKTWDTLWREKVGINNIMSTLAKWNTQIAEEPRGG